MKTFSFPDKHSSWSHLHGASLSLALAQYCESHIHTTLIISKDHASAHQLYAELLYFLPQEHHARCRILPDWEILPYDPFSPHQDIISERLSSLVHVLQYPNPILVVSLPTLMHFMTPPAFITQRSFLLECGQTLNIQTFRSRLEQSGYYAVNTVLEHGEFAVRGSIMDVYPMGSTLPIRIECFDDTIESLRTFDTDKQKTIEKIERIHILPAREFPLEQASIALFRQSFQKHFSGNLMQCALYETVSEGRFPQGIEYYLPLFFETPATLFQYIPADSQLLLVDVDQSAVEQFWQEVHSRYEELSIDKKRPILPPAQLFIAPQALLTQINHYKTIRTYHGEAPKKTGVHLFNSSPIPLKLTNKNTQFDELKIYSEQQRCLLITESEGRLQVLQDLLKKHQLESIALPSWQAFLESSNSALHISTAPLISGAEIPELGLRIIVESELFGAAPIPQRRSQTKSVDPDFVIRHLAELQIGDPVVHLDFGVGRYQGLQLIDNQNMAQEFLIITYAAGDKIYVPITALHRISRYSGSDPAHAPLHKLGSDQWQKAKKKAIEKITDIATELLEVYAQRKAKKGHRYQVDLGEYQTFAQDFPFTETVDQQRAIYDIMQDMQSERPMERLICGEVGFGKTEVAMRAAFIAMHNTKQVCVLVPTTLLASQHYETFQERFAPYPFRIEVLSRFKSAKESQQILEGLENGKIDCVIGTHKLLGKKLPFQDLGLLIIDEEHRFGVKQKEHIQALRHEIDLLSMTATPIPRTLNMAMHGLRDISLIATPPAKRLSVKTFWHERSDFILREAILREILRGGQAFFLHNNVQTIMQTALAIQTLIPEAKVEVAHGQMPERTLERIMSDFYHQRFNVLVCTTIIETGIDIPTANTILIDRADCFGLAQLHQLRGRVGRSHHQAYAYLLTPPESVLTTDAQKRLEAIVSLDQLGVGFTLATHDLEIRGAGALLGEEQSGNIESIGFSLFMEMLEQAVKDLQSGKHPHLEKALSSGPDIEIGFSTVIPEDYLPDVHNRLIQYKRIAHAAGELELRELEIEMRDRFGALPVSTQQLFSITRLKHLCEQLGVIKLSMSSNQAKIYFNQQPNIRTEHFIHLLQTQGETFQMDGPTSVKYALAATKPLEQIQAVHQLLATLSKD
ncbi:MAG: transcription-repair coupling factor [Legionellaceae bacterium]|nr:transcription-repair coupling factor [Legionellaceae bacterium]